MSKEIKHANSPGHGSFERSDIGVAGVIYFLAGLAVAGLVVYFVVNGLFWYLDKHFEAQQTPVSPLVTNAPSDTRRLPPQYKENYEKYLKEGFPVPQLEVNERTELNDERLREENMLSTYDYIDKSAGTVRIPIDRAMELIAQRGLPVRSQADSTAKSQPKQNRGTQN